MQHASTLSRRVRRLVAAIAGASALVAAASNAQALPEIRTNERNRVPACVTPERLMRFLTDRNQRLDQRFTDIARIYKAHGEANKVRWDYAFFQMILETNYLIFKNGAGQGDVNPRQNNFAGIGTTGGGVPGDEFPDVSTGVLAQMQHLIAYSGEHVENPVGRRTREKQDDIIARSKQLNRPVTFKDLTRRWATDSRYGTSIEAIAGRFRDAYCNGKEPPEPEVAQRDLPKLAAQSRTETSGRPAHEPRAAFVQAGLTAGPLLVEAPRVARRPTACRVYTASYGGERNVLIRAIVGDELQFTALQVIDGQERPLAEAFIKTHARGGDALGAYPTRDAALTKAFELCPSGRETQ